MHGTNHLQAMFSEYAWHDILVSDNGPCYIAIKFRQSMDVMGAQHIKNPPHHHQSNGLAEKYAHNVKACYAMQIAW